MNNSLFTYMPSKALITLLSANNIKDKTFGNPDWRESYSKFCEQTGFKDINADKFLTYVKFYSKLQKRTEDRVELAKDGTATTTMTRMIDRNITRKSMRDYRAEMIGRYYAN